MNRTATFLVSALSLCAQICLAAPITIETVHVGNPGNANDPSDGAAGISGVQNYGAVTYDYRIGKYEVTTDQYVAFLNEKAKSDPLGLFNPLMASSARGEIIQSGVSGSFTYASKPDMGNKPVGLLTWFDAIRFANWMHNGQGTGSTETGAYTILGGTPTPSNGNLIVRNPGAKWFLPNENEWYKAAYYQPESDGGDADNYWLYPTRSNAEPTLAHSNSVGDIINPGANVANYHTGVVWNGLTGFVSTVGSAGPLSASYYGTYDQGGNVMEWTDVQVVGSSSRLSRGGGFIINMNSALMRSSGRALFSPTTDGDNLGFRLATLYVPEPSSLALAAFGFAGLAAWGMRRRAINR